MKFHFIGLIHVWFRLCLNQNIVIPHHYRLILGIQHIQYSTSTQCIQVIKGKWFLLAVGAAGPAAIVALESGWITTEVGRQPWIVYGHMLTSEAVTDASGIPVVWALLGVVYLGLLFGAIWALRRLAKSPPEPEGPAPLIGSVR